MKKQLRVIEIAVVLLTILSSGCMENSGDSGKNIIIGTWETIETSLDSDIWTFYSNNTVKTISTYLEGGEEEPYISTSWSNYEIDGDKLCFTQLGEYSNNPPMCFDYEFSNGNKNLTLFFEGVVALALSKV